MAETAFIYALLDNGKPVYVGWSKDPAHRAWIHRRHCTSTQNKRQNPALCAWLGKTKAPPAYRIIAQVAYADRFKWEAFYTERLRENFDLFNIQTGGTPTPEVIARFIAAGRTPEARAKQGATISVIQSGEANPFYGKHHSPEAKAKIGAAFKGKPWSEARRKAQDHGSHSLRDMISHAVSNKSRVEIMKEALFGS